MREGQYQTNLIRRIKSLFPDCVVLLNDPRFVQGIPDILILYRNTWAMLEVKMDHMSSVQPNQGYYISLLNNMSYASFINPETEEDVLNELQFTFGLVR